MEVPDCLQTVPGFFSNVYPNLLVKPEYKKMLLSLYSLLLDVANFISFYLFDFSLHFFIPSPGRIRLFLDLVGKLWHYFPARPPLTSVSTDGSRSSGLGEHHGFRPGGSCELC